jgi:hypothetical protein
MELLSIETFRLVQDNQRKHTEKDIVAFSFTSFCGKNRNCARCRVYLFSTRVVFHFTYLAGLNTHL